jgi:hypothetical protein
MSTQTKNYASTPQYRWSAETLWTTKGGMRRIKRLFEASGQLGLTPTRIARTADCTIQYASCLIDTLATEGAVKARHNTTGTYAINPHYTGNVWSECLA